MRCQLKMLWQMIKENLVILFWLLFRFPFWRHKIGFKVNLELILSYLFIVSYPIIGYFVFVLTDSSGCSFFSKAMWLILRDFCEWIDYIFKSFLIQYQTNKIFCSDVLVFDLIKDSSEFKGVKKFRFDLVVIQSFETDVGKEYVIKGNDALMKCSIPSFVADTVSVVSWTVDEIDLGQLNNQGMIVESTKKDTDSIWTRQLKSMRTFWISIMEIFAFDGTKIVWTTSQRNFTCQQFHVFF